LKILKSRKSLYRQKEIELIVVNSTIHIQLAGKNTMQSIIFPLQTDDLPALANLQDALQLFLDQRVIFIDSSPLRQELTNGLKEERTAKVYKSATQRLVTIFQQSHQMPPPEPPLDPTGTIDA
jgi:hypothetical protein